MPEQTPKPEDGKDNKEGMSEEALKVLQEIKDKIGKPPDPEHKPEPTGPTVSEQREALRKTLGYTEEQMTAHEEMIMRSQAPIIERTGWQAIEAKADFKDLEKEIQEEVKFYAPERRTPEMMQKIYFYVKGRHLDSKPAAPEKSQEPPKERITRGPGYSGEPPIGAREGSEGEGEEDKLSETEAFVARKLGVTEKDYARARKAGRDAWRLKPEDGRQFNSMADIEMRKLISK